MVATAATVFLVGLSPFIIAAVRRDSWSEDLVFLIATLTVIVLYSVGQYFDGLLTWFPAPMFWIGLAATWQGQQWMYKLTKRKVIKPLERLGN